jgi:heme/copper-type cytochrome/quinol oxidase subunit 3
MFFVSFFWAFFDASLVPSIEGGATWPPFGIKTINPFGIPLLNTILLVFSRVLLTWAHKEFFRGKNITWKLWGTLLMGVAFMYLQFVEYQNSKFTIRRGVYGSVFYLLTGLHGCHVFLGGVFIFIFIIGYEAGTYSRVQHIWLELASVY